MIADRVTAHLIFTRESETSRLQVYAAGHAACIYIEREIRRQIWICAERFPTDSILAEMIAICCIMFTIIDGAE